MEPSARAIHYFYETSKIPHPSGREHLLTEYLREFADAHDLAYIIEESGSVIIRKEASPGYEKAPGVILQGHIDMVCEKRPEIEKDFLTEGIDVYEEDGFFRARGTTLGGDDGIATAYMLAILEDRSLQHPAIEAVFTTEEETNMNGARTLPPQHLSGQLYLNLDGTREGVFYVTSAGSTRLQITLPAPKTESTKNTTAKVRLFGMKGGHSGSQIHEGKMNAIQMLGRLLLQIAQEIPFEIADLRGGKLLNVIASEAQCLLNIEEDAAEKLAGIARQFCSEINEEHCKTDHCEIEIEKMPPCQTVICPESSLSVARFLGCCPFGIQKMSDEIEGLVETSQNIGKIALVGETVEIGIHIRSAKEGAAAAQVRKNQALAALCGGHGEIVARAPAWKYRADSPLREKTLALYREMFGKQPQVKALHGGLECGYFDERYRSRGLDIVSFAPDILDVHSVKERVDIESFKRMYAFTCRLLSELK